MSLVAWYEMRQNARDKSKYKNHGQENNVQWSSIAGLNFAYFNQSYISIPESHQINTSGPYLNKTISLIINPQDIETRQVIYKQGYTNTGLVIYIYDKRLYVLGYDLQPDNEWQQTYLFGNIQINKWYHVVLQIENGQYFKGFINARQLGTKPGKDIRTHSGDILVGKNNHTRFHDITTNDECYYNGYLIELKHYNNVLSNEFIRRYYEEMIPHVDIIQPKQLRSVEAFKQRMYTTLDDHVYLNRSVNHLANILGNDVVLNGLNIEQYYIDGGNLIVNINRGVLIQDLALIEITEDQELSAPLEDDTTYILYTKYRFLESKEENSFYLMLDKEHELKWNSKQNRIVLGVITYKNGELFLSKSNSIQINEQIYYIRGLNKFNMIGLVFDILRHYDDVFVLPQGEFIDNTSAQYGQVFSQDFKTMFGQNGNLIFTNTEPYFDTRYLIREPKLSNDKEKYYKVVLDGGNLILRNYDEDMDDEYINPNIKDIGNIPQFLHNRYRIKVVDNNVVLEYPTDVHSLDI